MSTPADLPSGVAFKSSPSTNSSEDPASLNSLSLSPPHESSNFHSPSLHTASSQHNDLDITYLNFGPQGTTIWRDKGFAVFFLLQFSALVLILSYYLWSYQHEDVQIYSMSFEMDWGVALLAFFSLVFGLVFGFGWFYILRLFAKHAIRFSLVTAIVFYFSAIGLFIFTGYFWSSLLMVACGAIMCWFFFSMRDRVYLHEHLLHMALYASKPYTFSIFLTSALFAIIASAFVLFWFAGSLALISTIYQHHLNHAAKNSLNTPSESALPYLLIWALLIAILVFIVEVLYNTIHVVLSGALAAWWYQSRSDDPDIVSQSQQMIVATATTGAATTAADSSLSPPHLPPLPSPVDEYTMTIHHRQSQLEVISDTSDSIDADSRDVPISLLPSSFLSSDVITAQDIPADHVSKRPRIAFERSSNIVFPAIKRALFYNFGSIVLGSLFSSTLRFFHYLFALLQFLENVPCLSFISPCVTGFRYFCEYLIQTFNIYTFCTLALSNDTFLGSAMSARRLLRTARVEQLPHHEFCQMVISFGSLACSIICCVVGGGIYCWVINTEASVTPFFVASFCGYLTTGLVLQPIVSAVATTIMIYAADKHRMEIIFADRHDEWNHIVGLLQLQETTSNNSISSSSITSQNESSRRQSGDDSNGDESHQDTLPIMSPAQAAAAGGTPLSPRLPISKRLGLNTSYSVNNGIDQQNDDIEIEETHSSLFV